MEEAAVMELENDIATSEVSSQAIPKREQVYTVDEVISKIGLGFFQILITIFCGGLWVADALVFMVFPVLSPALKCQWNLSGSEEALISSIVFVGFFFGGLVWGVVFDAAGRKTGLFIVNLLALVFGLLSALPMSSDDSKIPGFPWLLLCRCGVGFATGGTVQAVTYYTEFLPLKARGPLLTLLNIWWALGVIFGSILAVFVLGLGDLSWHWYLGLSTAPLALVMVLFLFVPESARFYLVKGQHEKARKVIERVAWFNRAQVPPGRLILQEEKQERGVSQEEAVLYIQGTVTIPDSSEVTSYDVNCDKEGVEGMPDQSDGNHLPDSSCEDQGDQEEISNNENGDESELLISDSTSKVGVALSKQRARIMKILKDILSLFSKDLWRTTCLLLFLWFGVTWLYYGVVLLTTTLLQYDPHCGIVGAMNDSNDSNSSICEGNQLDTSDFLKITWTSAAEIPGIIITVFIIEIFGRKITMAVEFILCMIGFSLLFICASNLVITFFLFLIRVFATGVFQAIYVYTPEVYPTRTRAIGMGVHIASARIGGLITPYVAQVLIHASDYATISLYTGSSLVLAVLAMLLPIETKGRALHDKS